MSAPEAGPVDGGHGDDNRLEGMLVGAVQARLDDLHVAVVADIRGGVPSFARMDEAGAVLIRRGMEGQTGTFLEVLLGRRRMTPAEAEAMAALTARPPVAAVPYDELMQAFWLGVRRTWQFLIEEAAARSASPEIVDALGTLLLNSLEYIQDVGRALTDGYLTQQNAETARRVRAHRELVDDLLGGAFDDDREIEARAYSLGAYFENPYGMVLLVAPHVSASLRHLRRARAALLTALAGTLDGSIRSHPAPHAALVVPAPSDAVWDRSISAAGELARKEGVVALVLEPARGPAAIHARYREGADLTPLAASCCESGPAYPSDLAVYQLLAADPEEAEALADAALAPLAELPPRRREALLEVLDALWDTDGRVSTAARALGLTEKAVRYRIARLESITGLRVFDPRDRLRLDLARHALHMSFAG